MAAPASFLLIFRDSNLAAYERLTPEQRRELVAAWNAWYDGLAAKGQVQQGHPLQPSGRVISGARGEKVTDGPYAETKEIVAGYFFLTVPDLAAATAIAQQCPSLPLGISVEVRPVAEFSPVLTELRGRPQRP